MFRGNTDEETPSSQILRFFPPETKGTRVPWASIPQTPSPLGEGRSLTVSTRVLLQRLGVLGCRTPVLPVGSSGTTERS